MNFVVFLFLALVAVVSAFKASIRIANRAITKLYATEKKEAIGKAELVEILKDKTGFLKKDLETMLESLTATIREQVLEEGKELRMRDLGIFKQKVSVARLGRNPRTGEELQIAGGRSVSFSVSSTMKVKDSAPAAKKTAAPKAPAAPKAAPKKK